MTAHSLLLISGSLRREATNRKLMHEAARLYGEAEVTVADLRLPLYDGDLEQEQGIPPEVQRLAGQVKAADAVIISSPEYNKMITGVLKNALDWVSRVEGHPWRDKPVAVMSANAGRAGGETGQYTVRHALTPFRPRLVIGPAVMVADARNEFGDGTRLKTERYVMALTGLMEALRREVAAHEAD